MGIITIFGGVIVFFTLLIYISHKEVINKLDILENRLIELEEKIGSIS